MRVRTGRFAKLRLRGQSGHAQLVEVAIGKCHMNDSTRVHPPAATVHGHYIGRVLGHTPSPQFPVDGRLLSPVSPRSAPPPIRFLFIGPRFRSLLPPHAWSPTRSSSSLRLGWSPFGGTFTPKMTFLLGAPVQRRGRRRVGRSILHDVPAAIASAATACWAALS